MPFTHAFRLTAPDNPTILWDTVQIEESATQTGTFTQIDSQAWPDQATPGTQEPQEISTSLATLAAGWYRFRWTDNSVPSPYTAAVYSPSTGTGYSTPALLRTELDVTEAVLSDVAALKLIAVASDLTDELIGPREFDTATGRKVAQDDVEAWQWTKLQRFTTLLAAEIYLNPELAKGRQWGSVSGPDFAVSRPLGGDSDGIIPWAIIAVLRQTGLIKNRMQSLTLTAPTASDLSELDFVTGSGTLP